MLNGPGTATGRSWVPPPGVLQQGPSARVRTTHTEWVLNFVATATNADAVPYTDVVTTWATVGALLVSVVLGFLSIRFTLQDRSERRESEKTRWNRVFAYGELEPEGVRIKIENATEFPVRSVHVYFFGYMPGPPSKALSSPGQTAVPSLAPGQKVSLWFGFDRRPDLVGTGENIAVRVTFIDLNGQAWVRTPGGKVMKMEELGEDSGMQIPEDLYSYKGPHS